jgi:glycosyltransferase involved in cell wall biosynthesis
MFSIIIPLYNKETTIVKTLLSILNQSFSMFEIIIVNDGSTDDSYKNALSLKDERIILINQLNKGVSEFFF